MVDIMMCRDKDCPSAHVCSRFTAKPDTKWQYYTQFERSGASACSNFIPVAEDAPAAKKTLFNPTKPVKTRGGQQARIICTDASDAEPIIAVLGSGDYSRIYTYTAEGRYHRNGWESNLDLINIPETTKRCQRVFFILSEGGTKIVDTRICPSDTSAVNVLSDREPGLKILNRLIEWEA